MANNKQMYQDEGDSWEVRAFEEDTSRNLMGCTWPPCSYTCTYCRRDRSAQALGGHMNVHSRDRARLHEIPKILPAKLAPSSTLLILTQEFVANGLCLFYSFPNPNPNPDPNGLSIPTTKPMASAHSVGSSVCHSSNTEPSSNDENAKDLAIEELDLELRLGR